MGKQDEYKDDIMERFNNGELMHADSIHYNDSLRVETLKLHRPVYGGGGIYPDRFVPLDTTDNTKYYRNVMAKGLINRYVISYVDSHRKEIKNKYPTDSDFVNKFTVSDSMLNDLYDLATKEGIEFDEEQATKSVPLFSMIIKALIGRDIYENGTYFKVYNTYDPIFKEAYKLINSSDYNQLLSPPQEK